MGELLSKYLAAIAGSTFKFIFGPLAGIGSGLSFWETYLCTVIGMMTTVLVLSSIGTPARAWLIHKLTSRSKKKKVFNRRNRQIVKIWSKYGMRGVAFFTPLLLTPPGGTLIAISFGETRQKIVVYMLVSAIFWGALITAIVYILGEQVVKGYLIG